MRLFGKNPSSYYRLNQPKFDYEQILDRCKRYGVAPANMIVADFRSRAEALLEKLSVSSAYQNLLKGVHIPFVFQRSTSSESDLGSNLENTLLSNLQDSFKAYYPEAHFKAVLQSNSELSGNITIDPASRYQRFIDASYSAAIVGWYFPQATQEYDVKSQREQMVSLPELGGANICLSGGMDVCAALVGTPSLLISNEFYTPILCLSAYVHADPRLILLLKAYGPHMEFWCMTQMLSREIVQVSEQWSGGITAFE